MRRKAKRLFQILAVCPQRKIHREELAEMLFTNKTAAQANANLSRVLHLARRALEPALKPYAEPRFFRQYNQIIELAAPPINLWIDADEFKRRAESGLKTNEMSSLEAAAALYAGDLLPDALYEQWAIAPREQLRQLYLRVLHCLAETAEKANDRARAHIYLDKLLDREATDEAACRAKIRLYVLANQKNLALRQYENLKKVLAEQFDCKLEPETEKLRREIQDSSFARAKGKTVYVHTPAKTDVAALEAEQSCLKGAYLLNKRTSESLFLSLKFFRQAIAFNQKMTAAYIGLANAYNLLGAFYGALPSEAAHEKAFNALHSALRIDETIFDAHVSLAHTYFADWQLKSCRMKFEECRRATQNSELMRQWYMEFLTYTGNHRKAIAEAGKFVSHAPALLPSMNAAGHAFYYAGNVERAAAKYREVLELEDNFAKARLFLGHALREQGKIDEALNEFRRAFQISAGGQEKAALAHAFALSGERGKAEYLLKQMLTKNGEYVSPCHIAVVLLGLNRKNEALACLEKAAREHSATLIFLPFDPLFEPLRKSSLFQKILINLECGE